MTDMLSELISKPAVHDDSPCCNNLGSLPEIHCKQRLISEHLVNKSHMSLILETLQVSFVCPPWQLHSLAPPMLDTDLVIVCRWTGIMLLVHPVHNVGIKVVISQMRLISAPRS